MKYFKDTNNKVWAFDDNVEDINTLPNTPSDLVSITEDEAKTLSEQKTQEQLDAEKKQAIELQLSALTVTTSEGHTFDAYSQARQDMADAILASSTLGVTKTVWRLTDNSEVEITLDELKEAQALAIQEYAKIKGIGA